MNGFTKMISKTIVIVLTLALLLILAGFAKTVYAKGPSNGQFSGPPRIFLILPTSSPSFIPVGIGGSNFDNDNPPFSSSGSAAFTIIPPSAGGNPGDVITDFSGQRSNPFPFVVQ